MSDSLLFDQSIQKLNVLYKFSGLILNKREESTFRTFKDRWLYTLNLFGVLIADAMCVYYLIVGASQGKNFVELTSVAPCLTFSILSVFKSFYHIANESEVFKLIAGLRELEIRENQRVKTAEKEEIVKEDSVFLNRVINMFYFLNCSMIVVFDFSTLVMIVVIYFQTNEFLMLLPFLDAFIILPYEFKYWIFSYVHQVWTECAALLYMAAADCLFFTCCVYIKMQFRCLKHDFERIFKDGSDARESRGNLPELVKWHQDLIESSSRLEAIYTKSNLLNFLSSSIIICLTGFNVTMVDDAVVVITYLTFLAMGLMQVFFLCFFADMLMSASEDVGNGVYNSLWYLKSPQVAKDLLLVQTRAQKPCVLTASGFADVNLKAFTRVLSTSWSYFALLQSVYGR